LAASLSVAPQMLAVNHVETGDSPNRRSAAGRYRVFFMNAAIHEIMT
jgi:hypothetical protein